MGHGCSQARRVQDGPTGSRWRLRAHREGAGAVPGAVWHCVVGSEVGCRALPAPQLLPERPPGLSRDPCCCPRPVSLCPLRGGQLAPQRFPHGARGVSPVSASRPGWRSARCPLNPRPHPSAPVGLTGLRGAPLQPGGLWPSRLPRQPRLPGWRRGPPPRAGRVPRASRVPRHRTNPRLAPCSPSDSPSPGVDLIAAFYGCLYCGCVPVTVRPPHPQNLATTLPTVRMIVEVCAPWAPTPGRWRAPQGPRLTTPGPCGRSASPCVSSPRKPSRGCSSPRRPQPPSTSGPGRPSWTRVRVRGSPTRPRVLCRLRRRGWAGAAEGRGKGAAAGGPASCTAVAGGPLLGQRTARRVPQAPCACGSRDPRLRPVSLWPLMSPLGGTRSHRSSRHWAVLPTPCDACGTTARAGNPWALRPARRVSLGLSVSPAGDTANHQHPASSLLTPGARPLGCPPVSGQEPLLASLTWGTPVLGSRVPPLRRSQGLCSWRLPDTFGRRGGVLTAPLLWPDSSCTLAHPGSGTCIWL